MKFEWRRHMSNMVLLHLDGKSLGFLYAIEWVASGKYYSVFIGPQAYTELALAKYDIMQAYLKNELSA